MSPFYNILEESWQPCPLGGWGGGRGLFQGKAYCLKRHRRVQRLRGPLRLSGFPRALGFYFQLNIWLTDSPQRVFWASLPHFSHPTPVLLPGKSHGWRSLEGWSPWGCWRLDMTENFTFTFHFHTLEKEMATHSSVLAWRIPGTGEPGGLHLWGHTESDTTEATQQQQQQQPHFSTSCKKIINPAAGQCI